MELNRCYAQNLYKNNVLSVTSQTKLFIDVCRLWTQISTSFHEISTFDSRFSDFDGSNEFPSLIVTRFPDFPISIHAFLLYDLLSVTTSIADLFILELGDGGGGEGEIG